MVSTLRVITAAVSLLLLCGDPAAGDQARPAAAQGRPAPPAAEQWLTDAAGRQYRLEPLPRAQAEKISDTQVRTSFGLVADLGREDERFFYLKIYRVDVPATQAPSPAPPPPPEPVMAAVEETHRFTFAPAGPGLPASGQWRERIVLADMTGDRRLDIVAGPARKTLRPPVVFVRDPSSGEWTRWADARFPERAYDYGGLAVGDLDGTGSLDIVLGIHLRGLAALRATGGGTFVDASRGLPDAEAGGDVTFSSRAVALVDCNGDGRPDLVALGEGPRPQARPGTAPAAGLMTYVNGADGTWQARPHGRGAALFGASLAVGDVDGDGRPDLVTGSAVLGAKALVHRATSPCGWTSDDVPVVRDRAFTKTVAVGQLDGDRQAEIVVAYAEFQGEDPVIGLDAIEMSEQRTWSRRAVVRVPGRQPFDAVALGDLDGDGIDEIVAADAAGTVQVFSRQGQGYARERELLASPLGCRASSIALGDLDGDGLRDIVVAYAQEASPASPGECPSNGGLTAWRTGRAASPPRP